VRPPLVLVLALAGSLLAGPTTSTTSAAAGDPGVATLRVVTADGALLVEAPLAAGETWTLAWLHSVAGTPVSETFAWRAGTMWLTEHRTRHLDIAGLGHTPGRGDLRDDGEGGFWIVGIDEPLVDGVHRFIIGTANAPTTLLHAGRTYDLSASHPGVRARIEVTEP